MNKQVLINSVTRTIYRFEAALVRYEKELKETPDSLFYSGLVKNTKEYIEECNDLIKEIINVENNNI